MDVISLEYFINKFVEFNIADLDLILIYALLYPFYSSKPVWSEPGPNVTSEPGPDVTSEPGSDQTGLDDENGYKNPFSSSSSFFTWGSRP